MKPSHSLLSPETSQSDALPTDVVIPQASPIHAAISGLVAIGATLGEAMRPYAKQLGIEGCLQLSKELAPTGLARMRALYEVQREFGNKKAFAQACLNDGFHPAGVAFGGLDTTGASRIKVRDLVRAFKVDTWLADRLDMRILRLMHSDLERINGSALYSGWPVHFGDPNTPPCDIPWLKEVSGLSFNSVAHLAFPSLTRVDGQMDILMSAHLSFPVLEALEDPDSRINIAQGSDITFPRLKRLSDSLHINDGKNIDLSALSEIEDGLNISTSTGVNLQGLASIKKGMHYNTNSDVNLNSLAHVGGILNVKGTRDLCLPALVRVDSDFNARLAIRLRLPLLTEIGGHAYFDSSDSLDLPSLQRIETSLYLKGPNPLRLPALEEVKGLIKSDHKTPVDFPSLQRVGGKPYRPDAKA